MHEAPPVAARLEGEPQDPERAGRADLAVGRRRAERQPWCAAGADHELADAVDGIMVAEWVLRGEALVVVIVAVEHQVGTGGVERVPERTDGPGLAFVAGGEPWVVPEGEGAAGRVGSQVGPEPGRLGCTVDRSAVAVQGGQVPGAEPEGVPGLDRRCGPGAEVPVVPDRPGRLVLVVARGRVGALDEPAPGRVVGRPVLPQRPVPVLVVTEQKHGRRVLGEDGAGGRPLLAAGRRRRRARPAGDVPGRHHHDAAGPGGGRAGRPGGGRGRRDDVVGQRDQRQYGGEDQGAENRR